MKTAFRRVIICSATWLAFFSNFFPSDHSLQFEYIHLLFKDVKKTRQQDLYTICGAIKDETLTIV